jgi:RNA polymerase sigma factor for flagellar operon FliA
MSFGAVGVLDAAARFDPLLGVRFETFAYRRIRGAIYDGVRAMSRLSIGCHRRNRREPRVMLLTSLEELGERGVDVESFDTAPDDALDFRRFCRRVSRAVAALPARERTIVLKHYYQGMRLSAAGAELGLSKSWTSRLHARAVEHLRILLG